MVVKGNGVPEGGGLQVVGVTLATWGGCDGTSEGFVGEDAWGVVGGG